MDNTNKASVTFGRARSKNLEHAANVLVKFANGDFLRGIRIFRKTDNNGKNYCLLVYPSYKIKTGQDIPFFKFNDERERKIIDMFHMAERDDSFVTSYQLPSKDLNIFSTVYDPISV